jgi:mannosyltransferase
VLWEDELITSDLVRRGTSSLFDTLIHQDAAFLVYGMLMHFWVAVFGDSPIALRLPTVMAMTAAAGCVALLGRRLFGAHAGLAAGLAFAVTPIVTRYGQEARVYAMVMLAATLSCLLLHRALELPDRRGRWIGYALSVTAVGLFNAVALAVLAAHGVAVGLRYRQDRRVLRPSACALIAGLALSAPVLMQSLDQSGSVISWVPRPDAAALLTIWPQLFASSLTAGVAVALATVAWAQLAPKRLESLTLATTLAVAPTLLVWISSHGANSYFFYRYLLESLPGWSLLTGAGLAAACGEGRKGIRAALATLAALTVVVLPELSAAHAPFSHFWYPVDYRGAAAQITSGYKTGDAVAYGRAAQPWDLLDLGTAYYLPSGIEPRDVFLASSAAQNQSLSSPVECAQPVTCLGNPLRIWLVTPNTGSGPASTLTPAEAALLRARYAALNTTYLTGVSVTLLERNSSSLQSR